MLKPHRQSDARNADFQPPSGGCVLKHRLIQSAAMLFSIQPPSGGCVLKRYPEKDTWFLRKPAAFRRLCVETKMRKTTMLPCCTSRLQAAVC